MDCRIIRLDETDSTNRWLKAHRTLPGYDRNVVVWADYQTDGRGCGTNTWESERGKNLLFSMLLHPVDVTAKDQFLVSKAVSVALCQLLSQYADGFSIKWPNDIYWHDRKICGMLIENTLRSGMITDSIVGIGLNVNQREFHSDAPNPVSLCQITRHEEDCGGLLGDFLSRFDLQALPPLYESLLYRRNGIWPYHDAKGKFMAELIDVEPDGRLTLKDDKGVLRHYCFKEVQFIID
ncbi:MAG: biotin--[Prevotella sp.]|nr:biotin--[acetyl-CoA-carboxylase] ligase [Prevotella sp.]